MTILPRIPRDEYAVRWRRAQRALKDESYDMLFAYADDRHTYGAAYARYYADIPCVFEPLLVLFATDGAPMLLVGPETVGYAAEVGAIPDIRVLREFAAENEDYPFTRLEGLREVAAERVSGEVKRIGIAGATIMSADIERAIRSAFPDAELIPADAVMEPLRGVKSAAELRVIEYAYYLANLGMAAAIRAIRPGVAERDIAAEAEYAMRKAGSEGTGIDTIVASGPNTRHILGRTTMRRIGENDLVIVTVAPRYEGYHGACGRTVVVGNPPEEEVRKVRATIEAQNLCGANLIAGKVGSAVEQMGRDCMAKYGYGENFLYSGLHSVGVIEFEPPILGPSSRTVLADNMVVSVDIPLFEAEGMGVRTEDGYVIEHGLPRKLTTAAQFIQK